MKTCVPINKSTVSTNVFTCISNKRSVFFHFVNHRCESKLNICHLNLIHSRIIDELYFKSKQIMIIMFLVFSAYLFFNFFFL